MARIFWFQPRDKRDGSLRNEYVECDERIASEYIKKPREMAYIGWSDGASFSGLMVKLEKDPKTGIPLDFSEERKEALRRARLAEIEKAKNSDKTPPRDYSKMNLSGGLMDERLKKFTL